MVTFASIGLSLAIVTKNVLELDKMDVDTVFLNEELNEEIHMDQSSGFVVKGKLHRICKLKRSIYCVKQLPTKWYLMSINPCFSLNL